MSESDASGAVTNRSKSDGEKRQGLIDGRDSPRHWLQVINDNTGRVSEIATHTLHVRISEITEESSRRLENWTIAIVGLTAAILVLTGVLVWIEWHH